jgi:hypothetical protein
MLVDVCSCRLVVTDEGCSAGVAQHGMSAACLSLALSVTAASVSLLPFCLLPLSRYYLSVTVNQLL